ncbi:MAG: GNAT family N-acetyltransferase [Planctomycetes bacterium]|nr:GNAT family N-acetyltransferase [Planctomycetota bacterium]
MDDGSIVIREGRSGDEERIARFNAALAEETEGIRLDADTVRAGVRALLADPSKGRYYLAERHGEVAGQVMVTYEWSDWRNAMFLWVQSVYVEPHHRREGVFGALFRHVRALAEAPGHCGLRLYVYQGNQGAQETYSRLGLVRPGYVVLQSPDTFRDAHG